VAIRRSHGTRLSHAARQGTRGPTEAFPGSPEQPSSKVPCMTEPPRPKERSRPRGERGSSARLAKSLTETIPTRRSPRALWDGSSSGILLRWCACFGRAQPPSTRNASPYIQALLPDNWFDPTMAFDLRVRPPSATSESEVATGIPGRGSMYKARR
jgi:hypothetical protein